MTLPSWTLCSWGIMQMCALNPVYVASAWFPGMYVHAMQVSLTKVYSQQEKGQLFGTCKIDRPSLRWSGISGVCNTNTTKLHLWLISNGNSLMQPQQATWCDAKTGKYEEKLENLSCQTSKTQDVRSICWTLKEVPPRQHWVSSLGLISNTHSVGFDGFDTHRQL